jgi:hypothetical protein
MPKKPEGKKNKKSMEGKRLMKNRGGSVEQVVSKTHFPLIEAQTLNAPNPIIFMAVLEAVYLFCLLPVCTEGRYVNRIFWAVRKLLQRVTNGTRFVRGGCSGNQWQRREIVFAIGDLLKHFGRDN